MEHVLGFLNQAWQSIVYHLTHMTLTGALWLGLAVLTIVLLVLMGTRWGHAKPVWKCVALSVFAHVLLGGYAYGTKLIFTSPKPPPTDTLALKLITSEEFNSPADDNATTQVKPWDDLDLSPETQPQPDEANRLQPAVQKTVNRTQPAVAPQRMQPLIPAEVVGHVTTTGDPEMALATPAGSPSESTAHQMDGRVADAPEIEIRRQSRDEPRDFNAPTSSDAMQVSRMDPLLDKSLQPENSRSTPQPLADENTQVAELLQQLGNAAGTSGDDNDISQALTRANQGAEKQSRDMEWGNPGRKDVPTQFASAPRRLADGKPMPEIYSGRSLEQRKEKSSRHGGSVETEKAVNDALKWLAATQEPDGSWNGVRHGGGQERLVLGHDREGAGTRADTGITGLSLLAFLAAGHSHLEGEYRETVQRGLEYLLRQQLTNGDMAGQARLYARMYCHAMATLAITETLAMTGDRRLRPAVEKAVSYSLQSQNSRGGGWRYRPGDNGDMSQFGWQVLVVKSAELGGIEIPAEAHQLMKRFLESCTAGNASGLAGYRPGQPPSVTMTAEALLCRHFLYDEVAPATASEACQYLLQELPGTGEENLYYWYYGTLAMFHTGGQAWTNWNHHLTKTLIGSQITEGSDAGSWKPGGVWAGYGGRVYSTAMAALCLEVYYRYEKQK